MEETTPAAVTDQIDAILAGLPADQRAVLQDLREAIAAAAPEAVEAISYGVPAFRYRGRPLAGYAGAKAHCSYFPFSPPVIDRSRDELVGFDTAKGTIRFTPEHPLPEALVVRLVRARMEEIDAGAG